MVKQGQKLNKFGRPFKKINYAFRPHAEYRTFFHCTVMILQPKNIGGSKTWNKCAEIWNFVYGDEIENNDGRLQRGRHWREMYVGREGNQRPKEWLFVTKQDSHHSAAEMQRRAGYNQTIINVARHLNIPIPQPDPGYTSPITHPSGIPRKQKASSSTPVTSAACKDYGDEDEDMEDQGNEDEESYDEDGDEDMEDGDDEDEDSYEEDKDSDPESDEDESDDTDFMKMPAGPTQGPSDLRRTRPSLTRWPSPRMQMPPPPVPKKAKIDGRTSKDVITMGTRGSVGGGKGWYWDDGTEDEMKRTDFMNSLPAAGSKRKSALRSSFGDAQAEEADSKSAVGVTLTSNLFSSTKQRKSDQEAEDERLARTLQEEENAKQPSRKRVHRSYAYDNNDAEEDMPSYPPRGRPASSLAGNDAIMSSPGRTSIDTIPTSKEQRTTEASGLMPAMNRSAEGPKTKLSPTSWNRNSAGISNVQCNKPPGHAFPSSSRPSVAPTGTSIPPSAPSTAGPAAIDSNIGSNATPPPLPIVHGGHKEMTFWINNQPYTTTAWTQSAEAPAILRANKLFASRGGLVLRGTVDNKEQDLMVCVPGECGWCDPSSNNSALATTARANHGKLFVHSCCIVIEDGVKKFKQHEHMEFIYGEKEYEIPNRVSNDTVVFSDGLERSVHKCDKKRCVVCKDAWAEEAKDKMSD